MTDLTPELVDKLTSMNSAGKTVELLDGKQGVMVPSGDGAYEMKIVDPVDRILRSYIEANASFDTQESFIAYVEEFGRQESKLFVRMYDGSHAPAVTAIFDYHDEPDVVGRLAHRATYAMPWSPQWKRWSFLANGDGIKQAQFLEFLQENGDDVVEPNVGELMAVIGNLSSRKKVEFKSGFRLSDGSMELSYVEETESAGASNKSAIMPESIEIGIPIFVDGVSYAVKVWLRYRIIEGKLLFGIVLHRAEFMIADATEAAVKEIETATKMTALWGRTGGDYGRGA